MIKKNQKWEWTERQEKVFKKLKEKFTKEPVVMNFQVFRVRQNKHKKTQ